MVRIQSKAETKRQRGGTGICDDARVPQGQKPCLGVQGGKQMLGKWLDAADQAFSFTGC